MEVLISIVLLGVIIFLVARKIPNTRKEYLASDELSDDGDGLSQKLNKYDSSETDSGKRKKRERLRFASKKDKKSTIQELLEKVDESINSKDYGEAEKMLIAGLEVEPANPKIYSKLGIIYLEQENYADAKESFKIALKYDKLNDLTYNNLGLALFNQGRYMEAIEAYQKSIHLNSLIPHRYINLGLAHAALRKYDKALDAYKKALVLDKNNDDYQRLIKETTEKINELKGI